MTKSYYGIDKYLHEMTWEDLFILAGDFRFSGGSILCNRTLRELDSFVGEGIFSKDSESYKFVQKYNKYITSAEDESERLRRWLVLMIMCDYKEELNELKAKHCGGEKI